MPVSLARWVCFPAVAALTGCAAPSSPTPPPASFEACTLAEPTPADWRLSSSGTSFRDSLGRVVFLRGVDGGGRSKFAPYVPFDYAPGQYASALAAYMDRAASWGIDVLRVPFTWAALEPTQGQYDADWLSRYDQLLDAAWARGIYTVIDFHQDVYSEAFCGDGFPPWTLTNPPASHHDCPDWPLEYFGDAAVQGAFDAFWATGSAVQSEYLAAWDTMVARYKDKPGVLGFEPLNEPSSGTADDATFSATTLTAFYSMMVARMRSQAPSSLVFLDVTGIDGVNLSTMLGRPTGDGVVFTPHFYPTGITPAQVEGDMQKWAAVGAAWQAPVFVDEFGASSTASTTEALMAAHFAALDALGLSGSEWEYSTSVDLWNSETDSVVAPDGGALPVTGAVMRPFARAVAGSSVTQSYDATTKTYALAYTPAAGTTEVSLPSALYPGGYTLSLSGACADVTSVPGRLLLRASADGGGGVRLGMKPK